MSNLYLADAHIKDTSFSKSGQILWVKDTVKKTFTKFDYHQTGELLSLQTLDSNGYFANEDIVWFDNGDTALFVQFDSTGLLSRSFFSKYKNGNLKTKGTFVRACLVGKFYEYYETGKIKMSGSYASNVNSINNIDSLVNLPRNRRSDITFKCYLKVDEFLMRGGSPDIERTYYCFRPLMTGTWIEYDKKGRVISKLEYKDGILLE